LDANHGVGCAGLQLALVHRDRDCRSISDHSASRAAKLWPQQHAAIDQAAISPSATGALTSHLPAARERGRVWGGMGRGRERSAVGSCHFVKPKKIISAKPPQKKNKKTGSNVPRWYTQQSELT
jgi:hypothetical protein